MRQIEYHELRFGNTSCDKHTGFGVQPLGGDSRCVNIRLKAELQTARTHLRSSYSSRLFELSIYCALVSDKLTR
jgi:hypothetical protein